MLEFYSEWIKDTYRFYNTVRELGSLSDKELSSLGIDRNEIVMIASEQAIKKYSTL